jgi:hypothetical protein
VTEDGTEQLLPTVTGFAARQAILVLRKHNIAAAPLLQRAGCRNTTLRQAAVILCTIGYRQSARIQRVQRCESALSLPRRLTCIGDALRHRGVVWPIGQGARSRVI